MRYPVVLLDVGDTLIGPRRSFGAIYAEVLTELGGNWSEETLDRCVHETHARMSSRIPVGTDRYSYFPGGEAEYWRRFARRTLEQATGSSVTDEFAGHAVEVLRDAFLEPEAWQVFPDVVPTLNALRDEGVRLGIVSNWDSRLEQLLDCLDLAGYFDEIGSSHVERLEKPAAEFFHRVLARMGATPEQAVHAGDHPELDLAAARAAGLHGVLVDRKGRLDAKHGALPDLRELHRISLGG